MKFFINTNLKILVYSLSGIVLMICSFLIHHFDPQNYLKRTLIMLKPGSLPYSLFKSPPYEVFIKIYVFNITNSEAFLNGDDEKIKFDEIGPFTYREFTENVDSQFHDNGTLSFKPVRKQVFAPDLSISDPKDTTVVVPNVPLLAIASMLHDSSMFLNLGLASIVRMLDSQPIRNLTLEEYFWGYDDALVNSGSKLIPHWIDFDKFGLIDRLFNEGENNVNMIVDPSRQGKGSQILDPVERGRIYSVEKWNGSPGLKQWGFKDPIGNESIETNTKCNTIEGASDGSIFPQNINKDMSFRLYRRAFCRPFPIIYNHTSDLDAGLQAYTYKLKDDFLHTGEENPDNACYCKDPNNCFPSGLGEGSPCYYGFPAALSKPHYIGVDPEIWAHKVEGMKPNPDIHETQIYIHPETGLLMKAFMRMQLNLIMRRTKFISRTAPFNDMVLPLAWIEISVPETPKLVTMLTVCLLKVLPVVQMIVMYLFGIIGGLLIGYAGYRIILPKENTSDQQRPSLSLIGNQYSSLRIIPAIRRQSILNELKDREKDKDRTSDRLIDNIV